MSEQNSYIKDDDLHTLSKEELAGRLISARQYYRDDQATIESLTDQVGKAVDDVERLNTVIKERDAQIAALHEKLEKLSTPLAIVCKQAATAKEMIQPYRKDQNNGNGGQHESAQSE